MRITHWFSKTVAKRRRSAFARGQAERLEARQVLTQIIAAGTATDLILALPESGNISARLSELGNGQVQLTSADFETFEFTLTGAEESLTIQLGNGDNTLVIDALSLPQGRLTVVGQEGRDTVIFNMADAASSIGELHVTAELVTQLRPLRVTGLATFDGADSVRLTQRDNDFSTLLVRATGRVTAVDRNDLTLSAIHGASVAIATGAGLTLTDQVRADGGTVTLSTNHSGTASESLRMEEGASIVTTNDTDAAVIIVSNTLVAGEGLVLLGAINAGPTTGLNHARITIDASRGAIRDANGDGLNLRAGSVVMRARQGVGTVGDTLELSVSRIEGSGGFGDFAVVNSGSLTVGGIGPSNGVMTRGGAVVIRTQSESLVLEEAISAGSFVDLQADDAEVAGNNLVVQDSAAVTSVSGSIVLKAGDNLIVQAAAAVRAAGSVTLSADVNGLDPGIGAQILCPQLLSAGTGVSIHGGPDSDSFVLTLANLDGRLGQVQLLDDGGQNDVLVLTGSARADVIRVSATNVVGNGATMIVRGTDSLALPSGIEAVTLNGGEGEDELFVQPSEFTAFTVNGQAPPFGASIVGASTVAVGDILHLDTQGLSFRTEGQTLFAKSGSRERRGVTFAGMESVPVLPASTTTPLRFDFNATTGLGTVVDTPTEPGFTSVRADMLYTGERGFGWDSAVTAFRLRTSLTGPKTDLLNDGHAFIGSGVTRTFKANVSNGWVQVTVIFGSPSEIIDGLKITNGDTNAVLASDLQADSNEWDHVTFPVLVTDGTLDLKFEDVLGSNRRVSLAGMEIRPLNLQSLGFAVPGRLDADGVTVDAFTLINAPANGLVTVEGSISEIVGTDASPHFDGFQVQTDARGRAVLNLRRPGVSGSRTVTLASVTGEGMGVTVVEYAALTSRRFDFNTPTSATFNPLSPTNLSGYIGVLPTQTFTPALGFGWTTAPQWTTNPAFSGSALNSDGHRGSGPGTFRVAIENGVYEVHVHMGDATDHTGVSMAANGVPVINRQRIARNTLFEKSILVGVSNGFLELTFSQQDVGSADPHWVINGLEIQPAVAIGDITPVPIGEVPGDGVTQRTVRATSSLRPGTVITVSSTLGLVISPDADASIPGTQVLVLSRGAIEFELQAPMEGGVPVVDWQAVDGSAHTAAVSADFLEFFAVEQATRKFDFNRGIDDATMTPTENGWIPVRPNQNSAAIDGFGWTTFVDSFYSLNDPPGYSGALVRDGARGGGTVVAGTFQFSAEAGSTYDVIPYIGRFSWIIDAVEVSVEGVPAVIAPTTTYQTFAIFTIHGGRDINGDGLINVSFRDTGLTRTGWTAVALEVIRTGS